MNIIIAKEQAKSVQASSVGLENEVHDLDDISRKTEIAQYIGQLPEKYQVVMRLHHLEGCSNYDIAQQFAKPLGTVKSQISRGNKLLKKFLDNKDAENEVNEVHMCWRTFPWTFMEMAIRIEKLPKPYRVMLKLHYLDKLSYSQIAQQLERPIGTIKCLVSRGRKMLFE